MASRKPKGIADDIVGGVRNIVSPWLGTPPGELKQVTQFKQATRVAAEGLDQTLTGGMIKAGTQGNKALVQQAAVNAAALGVGYVAGKAAVTAAGAVAKTGVVPRIVNKFLPSQIGVHHSVTQSTGTPFTGTVRPSVANKGLTAMDQRHPVRRPAGGLRDRRRLLGGHGAAWLLR